MAMAKKGSRKISVDKITYLLKISTKIRKDAEWRPSNTSELVDTHFEYANNHKGYGVKDMTVNIAIQQEKNASSILYIKVATLLIDTLIGFEQLLQITPKQIEQLIRYALRHGWQPENEGDFRMNLVAKQSDRAQSILLCLPDDQGINTINDYANIEQAVELKLD